MKVHISPNPDTIKDDNGIGRIVHAQFKYLSQYDIELVQNPENADIIASHVEQGSLPSIDVLHCHGLYWTGDIDSGEYHNWHHTANQRIIQTVRKAFLLTVPSQWVALPFKRDMRIVPEIIGHGIDYQEWQDTKYDKSSSSFILWNKNRDGDVCDPTPPYELALRGYHVISTFAPKNADLSKAMMNVVGALPHSSMQDLIKRSGIYLATTQETFGVGTLEAMACGTPVLGYRWAGTADLVQHKETGYLVEPGDIDGLVEGIVWLKQHYLETSRKAREVAKLYDWSSIIGRYAEAYRKAYELKQTYRKDDSVSVIVTNYNYGRYVHEAIDSVLEQKKQPKEIIVVDDGSTDDSQTVLSKYDGHELVKVVYQANAGVAHARNKGIELATGRYILCLDADDKIDPKFLEILVPSIHRNRDYGIVYSGLAIINAYNKLQGSHWPLEFDWDVQSKGGVPPSNTVPSAALYRRDMWKRSGGYKQEYAPGEDAEFWARGLSIGYNAHRVTNQPLYLYRWHPQGASRTRQYVPIDSWNPWIKDKKFPIGAPSKEPPIVRSYSKPLVSLIVPVGPGHERYLTTVLDSILGQTFRNWEIVLINDTGQSIDHLLVPYPFVKLVNTEGKKGAGYARNIGLDFSKAPLCVFLDADDYLLPDALTLMLKAYVKTKAAYVYTDWLRTDETGELIVEKCPNYNQKEWVVKGQHAITVLIETALAKRFRFDEELIGWEDWDFFIKLAINGACGHRLAEPLLVYRMHSGQRREYSLRNKDHLLHTLYTRYEAYRKEEKSMAGCGGCGKSMGPVQQAKKELNDQISARQIYTPAQQKAESIAHYEDIGVTVIEPERIRMEYIGHRDAPVLYTSNNRKYRGSRDPMYKYINAHKDDVETLTKSGAWRVVIRPLQDIVALDPTPPEPSQLEAVKISEPMKVEDADLESKNKPDFEEPFVAPVTVNAATKTKPVTETTTSAVTRKNRKKS